MQSQIEANLLSNPGSLFGSYMQSSRQQIALLHARSEDVFLLSKLLRAEPFDVVSHTTLDELQDYQFESQVSSSETPSTWGVVMCVHNSDHDAGTFAPSHRVTDELAQLTGRYKRVLVLADSMDEKTVVTYLKAGAHHVFPLRESPRLIQARLIAGLREHRENSQHELNVGAYHFDLSRRAVSMDGVSLGLSPREFEFAHFLFANRKRIIPVAELLRSVWSLPEHEDARRIDTAACRLRKKMHLNDSGDWQLRRIRREGYELVRTAESANRLLTADET